MIGPKMGAATESSTSETPNEFTSVTDWFVFPSKQLDALPLRCVLRTRRYARLSWRTVGHSRPQPRSGEASGPPQIAPLSHSANATCAELPAHSSWTCDPASRSASRSRSAGERFVIAVASAASGSDGFTGTSSPRFSRPVFSSPLLQLSPTLVQTLVQTGASVSVSPCPLSLTSHRSLVRDQEVEGSNPFTPTYISPCRKRL